jgi:hypothetical protein
MTETGHRKPFTCKTCRAQLYREYLDEVRGGYVCRKCGGVNTEFDALGSPVPDSFFTTYRGQTLAEATEVMQADADRLTAEGFEPIAHAWQEGPPDLSMGLVGAALFNKRGTLTVTYGRAASASVAEDIAALLIRLEGLRDRRLITDEEFAAKKAEVLARI